VEPAGKVTSRQTEPRMPNIGGKSEQSSRESLSFLPVESASQKYSADMLSYGIASCSDDS